MYIFVGLTWKPVDFTLSFFSRGKTPDEILRSHSDVGKFYGKLSTVPNDPRETTGRRGKQSGQSTAPKTKMNTSAIKFYWRSLFAQQQTRLIYGSVSEGVSASLPPLVCGCTEPDNPSTAIEINFKRLGFRAKRMVLLFY